MFQLTLESLKETIGKLVWKTTHDDVEFRLYIPKWRVPDPPPGGIRVYIEPASESTQIPLGISPEIALADPAMRTRPILSLVRQVETKTKTIRFVPIGDPKDVELGEPYIPTPLTHNGSEYLLIKVEWNLPTRGTF